MAVSEEANNIAIEVNNLKKYFENVKAVDDISFQIKKGECFSFLGPNGAGKTTTINILSCYLKPSSGSARLYDYDVVKETKKVKQHIGISPQENIFFDQLNVYENIIFFGKMYSVDKKLLKRRASDLIKKVGLEEKRKTTAEKLSGGMKKRLNLIIGLVHDPDVLFLDEPTAGLDPQTRRLIWNYIEELKSRNKTIFLTTHYMDEADALSDRVGIIDHGKIIALGTPSELKATIGKGDLLEMKIEGINGKILKMVERVKSLDYVLSAYYSEEDLLIRIMAMDGLRKIGKIMKEFNSNGLNIIDVNVKANSLENVFIELTGRSLRE
jgi:ABC-2 type transport system ATP-binding protein